MEFSAERELWTLLIIIKESPKNVGGSHFLKDMKKNLKTFEGSKGWYWVIPLKVSFGWSGSKPRAGMGLSCLNLFELQVPDQRKVDFSNISSSFMNILLRT